MSRPTHTLVVLILILMTVGSGCGPSRPFYLFDDGDMSHYRDVATEIEYPDVESCRLAEVEGAMPPFTLENANAEEVWDLTLEEAVQITLTNSKVMRSLNGNVLSTPNTLLNFPAGAISVYDPALTETNPISGPESALAAFDAQFTTSMFWERNDRPVNLAGQFTAFLTPVLEQDLGSFQAQIQKTAATGGTFAVRNVTQYEFNNNPSNLFPSSWTTNMEAVARQPLLQGAGVAFNRINGPNAQAGGFFNNGVVIGRINTDITLADFEAGVRDLVSEVETAYWELYFTYRNLDSIKAGRDSALQTWRRVYALYLAGARGGEAEKEAQAREQYFLFRSQVESALTQLYGVESRLRYLMGLSATDGRLIRPADDPTVARVVFDWFQIHEESLIRSVELRKQKWSILQAELQLQASRNFLMPRLDFVSRYRWVGFGDDLIGPSGGPVLDNAWQTLVDGDYQEWQMGFEGSLNIGFRRELANVRNKQLELAKQRSILQDQELELSHQLSDAIRNLDFQYVISETQFNRAVAAQRQVIAVESAYNTGTVTFDVLLDAQRRLAEARSSFFRSIIDYNLAIRDVHLRKGSLLEYNGVYLNEGPWPAKAYFDARKRARERDAGTFVNYGFTRPNVVSRGPLAQQMHDSPGAYDVFGTEEVPGELIPEQIPTPADGPDAVNPGTIRPDASTPGDASPDDPSVRLPLERSLGTLIPQQGHSSGLPMRGPMASPVQAASYQQWKNTPGNEAESVNPTSADHPAAPVGQGLQR